MTWERLEQFAALHCLHVSLGCTQAGVVPAAVPSPLFSHRDFHQDDARVFINKRYTIRSYCRISSIFVSNSCSMLDGSGSSWSHLRTHDARSITAMVLNKVPCIEAVKTRTNVLRRLGVVRTPRVNLCARGYIAPLCSLESRIKPERDVHLTHMLQSTIFETRWGDSDLKSHCSFQMPSRGFWSMQISSTGLVFFPGM